MSANRSRPHDPIIHASLKTVGAMIDYEVPVTGYCQPCRHTWPLPLEKIAAKRGRWWCLWGRAVRCPMCRRNAYIHAIGPQGFQLTINALGTADYTEVKRLRGLCSRCGEKPHP